MQDRIVDNEWYEVRRLKGFSFLCIPHDGRYEPTTLDKVIEDIREVCERAKANGYNNDEKWQIVKCESKTTYDMEYVFCNSIECKHVVALYDNGVVTEIF